MEQYVIKGGNPLYGEVEIGGAKNAALAILAAAIMTDETVTIDNLPNVRDINVLLQAIEEIGAHVERVDIHKVKINGSFIRGVNVDNEFIRRIRASYYLIGALLGKYKHAEVALPGGCDIGSRPIDLHMKGFRSMGADIDIAHGLVIARAKELKGTHIYMDKVSVGATINIMMAAAMADGKTVIENAAKEPHVVDVANFLNSMGANIRGAGTDVIRIVGVERLHATEYSVIPDQIEAGTFMFAVAAAGGNVLVKNVIPKHLEATTAKLLEVGCQVEEFDDSVSAVKQIAGDLVKLYAQREQQNGYAFGEDTVWQREFEELFPFDETEDQILAIEATKTDMQSHKIMDRLICGDVGYGKTEVAIRAAFKAVQDSKQVAYLAPTTILAQQIYDTFSQRMKDFPVNVDLMCRFRSAAEQKKTIEKLKKGEVDIIIGTHRILSKDVQFKDLGLLVIDEEQRFGVTHKEKIKQMKVNVDVLTLTATPIPRTLHMSLIGIRDMSVLEEPPMDRVPIQTYVMEYNDELVREAINRELARNGQVYYVYNKVRDIADITAKLQELVPDATVAFAHGQMKETELERIMYRFINGEIDVLVSTTIIETGLDISNVNTMIIHDADNMGLSQLYQLRGRVGRSNRTAYAFLMYRRNKMLKEVAEKRLAAIKEYSDLGSGFKIAMRDLEIRGAGNLLGAEQSGHMEAVGYDLYCKMLSEAVKEAKGIEDISDKFDTTVDIVTDAYIPAGYIANEFQKLDIYKRIAGIETEEEKDEMLEELIDRFGEPPKSVLSLLRVARLKALAHAVYITEIKQTGSLIKLTMFERARINPEKIPMLVAQYKSSLKFNMAENPYFTFDLKNGSVAKKRDVLDVVEELISQMRKELITAE